MINSILPEHLVTHLLLNNINPDGYVITEIFKLKNKCPEKYKELLSNMRANFNGCFYYSECIEESIFNLMYSGLVYYDFYNNQYKITDIKRITKYYEEFIVDYSKETVGILNNLIEDIKIYEK